MVGFGIWYNYYLESGRIWNVVGFGIGRIWNGGIGIWWDSNLVEFRIW